MKPRSFSSATQSASAEQKYNNRQQTRLDQSESVRVLPELIAEILPEKRRDGEGLRMYRDDSPDYSAPMARRFSPPPRDLCPSYSPVRDQRRSTSRRSRSPRDRDHRRRSRSPDRRFKRERSFSPVASGSRGVGGGGGGGWETDLSREDEEILRSLHCRRCSVTLHDRDSMMAHIKVRPDF